MGGKSTSKTDQKQTQTVTLPAWMSEGGQQNYNDAVAYSKAHPVESYPGQRTAGMTGNQTQASQLAAQNAGQGQDDLNTARALTMTGATAQPMYIGTPGVNASTLGQAPTMQSVQQGGVGTGTASQAGWAGYDAAQAGHIGMGGAPLIQSMMTGSQNADASHATAGQGQAYTADPTMSQAYTGDAVTGSAYLANAGTSEAALMQAAQRGDAHTYDAAQQANAPAAVQAMMLGTKDWSNEAAQQYMNPYLQNVQDHVLTNMQRQDAEQRASLNDGLFASKAFGGMRQGVLESQLMGEQGRARQDYLSQSQSDAYNNAQSMFTSDQSRALQAGLGNQSAKLQGDIANAGFIDSMLGRNMDATNRAREFGANAWNTRDSENTGWLNDAARTNADNTTQVGINNARNITDTNNQNAGRETETSNQNASLITNMINNNANRLTDTSNWNAGRATDTANQNANRYTDTSNSNARLTTDTNNQNAGRDTDVSLQNARIGTETGWRNADRTLQADTSNQDILGRYALQDNSQANETDRYNTGATNDQRNFNANAYNSNQNQNADRAQAMDTSNLGWINQMLGANSDREQAARTSNLDITGRYAMADQDALNSTADANANRSLTASQSNQSAYQGMLGRMLQAGGQFADYGTAASNLTSADIQRLLQTGGVEQATNQAGYDNDYQEFLRMQDAGLDRYSTLAGILSGTPRDVNTSGTMNGTTVTKQSPGLMGTMLGLAQVGASFASDRRLKRNIERVGQFASGLGAYLFNYIWDEPGARRAFGVMADEVARLRPQALGPSIGGFSTVDYSKAWEG